MTRAKVSRTRSAAQVSTGGSGDGFDSAGIGATFSRPTSSLYAEKHDVRVATFVSDRLDDKLRKAARDNGFNSKSDFVRFCLELVLDGPDHVMSVQRQRIEALAQNLRGTVPGVER
jgi:Arc/MetJ-type ribon-helix-helix transcriptional regulator